MGSRDLTELWCSQAHAKPRLNPQSPPSAWRSWGQLSQRHCEVQGECLSPPRPFFSVFHSVSKFCGPLVRFPGTDTSPSSWGSPTCLAPQRTDSSKKLIKEAGEPAQWVKRLSQKHENLYVDPWHTYRKTACLAKAAYAPNGQASLQPDTWISLFIFSAL